MLLDEILNMVKVKEENIEGKVRIVYDLFRKISGRTRKEIVKDN